MAVAKLVGKGSKRFSAEPLHAFFQGVDLGNGLIHAFEQALVAAAKHAGNQFIQHVDRKTPLNEIARLKNISFGELLTDLEHIIYSGTRLNLDYYIRREMDEDTVDDIFDYFMQADTDDLDPAENELGGDYSREEIQLGRAKFIAEVAN